MQAKSRPYSLSKDNPGRDRDILVPRAEAPAPSPARPTHSKMPVGMAGCRDCWQLHQEEQGYHRGGVEHFAGAPAPTDQDERAGNPFTFTLSHGILEAEP